MTVSKNIKWLVLFLLFGVGIFLSLMYGGSEKIDFLKENSDFIFFQIRLPKTVTAILAGACLSVSGLILQIIFRNPLAGPYVLGISSGASLVVAVAIMAGNSITIISNYFSGKAYIMLASIIGSFLITILILLISNKVRSNVVLLLIGLMLSQICGALEIVLEYFADPSSLKSFVIWGMGTIGTTVLSDLPVFVTACLLSLLSVLFFIKPLNLLLLGENYAQNLGIHFKRNRLFLILISSSLTGIITAFCGPIAFVGIAVPILARISFNTSKQHVHYALCMLIGATLLLFADAICHSISTHFILPINMITTFIGAPLVIYLMFKNKQW